MKRTDFIQIIKLRSVWNVDKRKGNYTLPNGDKLSKYISELVDSQMTIDNLGIMKDGNLCFCLKEKWNDETGQPGNYKLLPDLEEEEVCTFDEMEKRIKNLVFDIIG